VARFEPGSHGAQPGGRAPGRAARLPGPVSAGTSRHRHHSGAHPAGGRSGPARADRADPGTRHHAPQPLL